MTRKLYELYYETYSYHGEDGIDLQIGAVEDFDLDDGELLGVYSSYDIALQRLEYFSKVYYVGMLKRLNIYDVMLDHAEWEDGFTV